MASTLKTKVWDMVGTSPAPFFIIHVFFPSFSPGSPPKLIKSGGRQLLVQNLWLPIVNYTDTNLTCIFPKTNSFWAKSKHIVSHKIMETTLRNQQLLEVFIHTQTHTHIYCLIHKIHAWWVPTGWNREFYIFLPHKASEDNSENISTIYVQAKKAGLWR